jgi:hypothetical protein
MANNEHTLALPLDVPWQIPPEKREQYERRQGEWEAEFPFEEVVATAYGIGVSSDGNLIGFGFQMPDGRVVRASLPPVTCSRNVLYSLMLAFERVLARQGRTPGDKAN